MGKVGLVGAMEGARGGRTQRMDAYQPVCLGECISTAVTNSVSRGIRQLYLLHSYLQAAMQQL